MTTVLNIKNNIVDIAINEFGIFKPISLHYAPFSPYNIHGHYGIVYCVFGEKDIANLFHYDFFEFIARIILTEGYGQSEGCRFLDHIISVDYELIELKSFNEVCDYLYDEPIKKISFIQAYGIKNGNDSHVFIQGKNKFIYMWSYRS